MKIFNYKLYFYPTIPAFWTHYSFNINFMTNTIRLDIYKGKIEITNLKGEKIELYVYDHLYKVGKTSKVGIKME